MDESSPAEPKTKSQAFKNRAEWAKRTNYIKAFTMSKKATFGHYI
jgi:hypothetical protein